MPLVQAAFSFGRDRELLALVRDALGDLKIHDLRSDLDANRTWLSISGDPEPLTQGLFACCDLAFDRIDLQRHAGEHPRTGALDLCRFVDCESSLANDFAAQIAERYALPVFRIDLSPDWPAIRESGFGGLIDRVLHPDHGPCFAHSQLGVVGVDLRAFFVTVTIELQEDFAHFALSRERDIRQRNEEGDPMFRQVTAFAYPTPSYASSRLIIEFGDPDQAPPDPVLEWLDRRAKIAGIPIQGMEAIGAVRPHDLLETRSFPIRPEQLYDPNGHP